MVSHDHGGLPGMTTCGKYKKEARTVRLALQLSTRHALQYGFKIERCKAGNKECEGPQDCHARSSPPDLVLHLSKHPYTAVLNPNIAFVGLV